MAGPQQTPPPSPTPAQRLPLDTPPQRSRARLLTLSFLVLVILMVCVSIVGIGWGIGVDVLLFPTATPGAEGSFGIWFEAVCVKWKVKEGDWNNGSGLAGQLMNWFWLFCVCYRSLAPNLKIVPTTNTSIPIPLLLQFLLPVLHLPEDIFIFLYCDRWFVTFRFFSIVLWG